MRRLVALDLPGGPAFVAELRRAWDQGDAVVVPDPSLPAPARSALLEAVRPHVSVGPDGVRTDIDPSAPLLDEGDALVATTSGSTGTPKVLVHTHAGLHAHAAAVHAHLQVDPAADRWLACLPLNHLGGFGVVARSVLTDTPVDVFDRFDAATVQASPTELGTTLVSLVTTALDRVDADAFRWVVLGGSADPTPRPANVVHTYGLTETGGGVVYEGVALPGVQVRVGDDGGIALRTPTLAHGRRSPDGTLTPLTDADGWLHTGDLGRWAADGRLLVDGRADHLIITGGENVWPEPVEAALRTHPAVADALVSGEPDPEWGQRVAATIVPTDPGTPPSIDDLRAHVKATLPAHAAPRALHLATAIPRTSLGKPLRTAKAAP